MNRRILLVDYEQKSLDEIRGLFEGEPFDLLTAADGSQALEIFEKESPDLVMTSALLPKMNGFELCKKIVSGQHGEVRPVIMFSGIYKAEKYRKEAIIGCGAVDFLEKPLVKRQLLKVIQGLFLEIPGRPVVGALELAPQRAPQQEILVKQGLQDLSLSSDDLLEVETLLTPPPQAAQRVEFSNEMEFATILETDPSETRIGSLNSIEREFDAALDAVRTDLDLAPKLRDQQLVEEIEARFFKQGPDILEFESSADTQPAQTALINPEAASEIIELDIPTVAISTSEPTEQAESFRSDGSEQQAMAAPQFTIGSDQPRNWLPFIAIFLAGLLVVLVLWLRG